MNTPSDITFSALDRHFGRLIRALSKPPGDEIELAAKLTSFAVTQGHICLSLETVAGRNASLDNFPAEVSDMPSLESWLEKLNNSSVVGRPGEFAPLILDGKNRLYLRRHWEYERQLAEAILQRARVPSPKSDLHLMQAGLDRFFPKQAGTDGQRQAALTALTQNFCVISGGPGTGKTRTVVVIAALLLEQAKGRNCKIALCAPTGKAAVRLKESVENTKAKLTLAEEIKNAIPTEATTIHRLLGSIPDSPYFRRHRKSPLVVDVVIVDEASMVDLALMAKLFDAIPPTAKVILLGDKDQLSSVEAGAVLADICHSTEEPKENADRDKPLAGCVVELKKNYRFGEESGIFRISQAVNRGQGQEAFTILQSGASADLAWRKLPGHAEMKRALRTIALDWFVANLASRSPEEAIAKLNEFRILCAIKQGPFGVEGINQIVEEILEEEGCIARETRWYHGRPVLVTRNDYNLKLFNGDVGILWRDEQKELRAYFPSADGTVRRLLPSRLPAHETVYAMTVHKSQGSEFKSLLFILPERDNPVLARELIYTGLTRARARVELWTNEDVFVGAVEKKVERASGLRDALW